MVSLVNQQNHVAASRWAVKAILAWTVLTVVLYLLPLPVATGVANYLPLHIFLETIAIVVASMVFAVSWHSGHREVDLRSLTIACFFLGVAFLDFGHMLSFQGMPDFVTPSSPNKAIDFWLAARSFAAAGILCAAIVPVRTTTSLVRYLMLGGTAGSVGALFAIFLLWPELTPVFFDADSGLSVAKIVYEYVLILIYLAAGMMLWKQSRELARPDILTLSVAAFVMALSEVFFTIYTQVSDVYNMIGHLYKVVAYVYVYQALVVTGITAPFAQLKQLNAKLNSTLDAIPDMMFQLSADGQILAYHSNVARSALLAEPAEFIGRHLQDFMPGNVLEVWHSAMSEIDAHGKSAGQTYTLEVSGGERWFELAGTSIAGEEGEKSAYLFLARDITVTREAERDAQRSRHILKAALDNLPVGVAVNTVADEIHFEYMNDNFPRFYGTTREELTTASSFWEAAYEDEDARSQMKARVMSDYESGDVSRMIWENVPITRKGQEVRYITAQNIPVPHEGLSISLVEDVTQKRKTEAELRIAATAFSSQEGIMITDADLRILRVNAAFELATGYSEQEVIGKTPSLLKSGIHEQAFYDAMWSAIKTTGGWHGEIWNRRKNGEVYPQSLSVTAVHNAAGEIVNYVGDFIDISDIKRAEEEINKLALYDTLTGLSNRRQFQSLLEEAIKQSVDKGRLGAVLMIDLDHFKVINDTLGHDAGDRLLMLIAAQLRELVRDEDVVSRYGGDEFMVMLYPLDRDAAQAANTVQALAQTILTVLDNNYTIDSESYHSTCSIGATLFGFDQGDAVEVFKQVDIALFQAKDMGRNTIRFFDPVWQAEVNSRTALLAELRDGIRTAQMELYFQPQLDADGVLVGAEALVRWNHPTRGLVSPADFIPLAEQNGLMLELGHQILELGLAQLKAWQSEPSCTEIKLSINLAAEQFYQEGFAERLESRIVDMGINPQLLMLEFTETTLLGNLELAQSNMGRLNKKGVQFAIDDFGTGYSSLTYLSELPVDLLKIDQSFVRNLGIKAKDAAIVRIIIDLAYMLEMDVLAEGVETEAQRDFLLAAGCTRYQGYLFSRPVPAAQFVADVAARRVKAN